MYGVITLYYTHIETFSSGFICYLMHIIQSIKSFRSIKAISASHKMPPDTDIRNPIFNVSILRNHGHNNSVRMSHTSTEIFILQIKFPCCPLKISILNSK